MKATRKTSRLRSESTVRQRDVGQPGFAKTLRRDKGARGDPSIVPPLPFPLGLAAMVLVAGILSGCGRKEDALLPATPPAAVNVTSQPAPAATRDAGFEKLKGKWERADGGYVVDIRSVEPGGKMDAAYFNPKSIHVAKAEASQEGAVTKVFIELRDVNYPGSTYRLTYDPGQDLLKGTYFQAVANDTYAIAFVRQKP
jgi:hypothetical protein